MASIAWSFYACTFTRICYMTYIKRIESAFNNHCEAEPPSECDGKSDHQRTSDE